MSFTPSSWNLSSIIEETRFITGRPDTSMISDQEVVNFINYFYQFVLTKELKIFWGYTYYQFFCQANVDQYVAPQNFQTLNPQVWADGWPIEWYISPDLFYQDWPQQDDKQVVAQGNGTLNNFSFQVSAYPILIGSLYVTDGTQVAQDNGAGGFTDAFTGLPLGGMIAYTSGTISGLAFASPPGDNTNITASYALYMPNRPQAILFYPSQPLSNSTQPTLATTNMFVLRPVPDQVYLIKMQGIQQPNPLINYTDVPFRQDLGPLIALGAALQIFKRFNQFDQYDQIMPEYMRYKDVCMQDTYEELLYERSVPQF